MKYISFIILLFLVNCSQDNWPQIRPITVFDQYHRVGTESANTSNNSVQYQNLKQSNYNVNDLRELKEKINQMESRSITEF